MNFPTLTDGQVTMFPAIRTRIHQTSVLRFLSDKEQRYRDAPVLAKFVLNFTDVTLTDRNTVQAFFYSAKGGWDATWQLTFDGVVYKNCCFDADIFQWEENKPNLFNFSLAITQALGAP